MLRFLNDDQLQKVKWNKVFYNFKLCDVIDDSCTVKKDYLNVKRLRLVFVYIFSNIFPFRCNLNKKIVLFCFCRLSLFPSARMADKPSSVSASPPPTTSTDLKEVSNASKQQEQGKKPLIIQNEYLISR